MKFVFSTTLALALLASAPALADGKIDVMTQNQYLGADLNPVIGAGDFQEFIEEATKALQQAAANNFPERAEALAQLIANRSPDVVGLQEVFNFTFDFGDGVKRNGPPPFVDHLQATLDALVALEEPYVAVAQVQNLDISVPGITIPELGVVTVGVTDRDVILVRKDLVDEGKAWPVPFSAVCARPSADGRSGCNYKVVAVAPLPPPLPAINIERGYVGVDVEVDGMLHRVVNTHLEVRRPNGTDESLNIQAFQAAELIQTLALFPNDDEANIVVVGDINSAPEDPTIPQPADPPPPPPFDEFLVPPYTQFAAFYTDAWALRPGANKGNGYIQGYSCCQADDLLNHQSVLDERIDVLFSAAVPNKVKKARVAGDRVSDKTPDSDLWPSDHGSVGAELQFE